MNKLSTFGLMRGWCQRESIKRLGAGWDSNKRETLYLNTYWELWQGLCESLGISTEWWL